MKVKKNTDGSAMIVVMCVMIVTVALSLTLLLTASIMITNAIRSGNKEQSRITAVAVSNLLRKEITNIRYDGSDGEQVPPLYNASGYSTTLAGKLKTVATTSWYAYNPDAEGMEKLQTMYKDYYTYVLSDSSIPGTTTIDLYWVDETGSELKEISVIDYPEEAATKFSSLKLYVRVTNTAGDESSTILNVFNPAASPGRDSATGLQTWSEWTWKYIEREWERGD